MKNWQFLFDADQNHFMRADWTIEECEEMARADKIIEEFLYEDESEIEKLWKNRGTNPISMSDVKDECADLDIDEWRFR